MFESIISGLTDRSAAGISEAAKNGVVSEEGQNARIIGEAVVLVEEGRGDWRYIGSLREHPQWEPPTGEGLVEEPLPERSQ